MADAPKHLDDLRREIDEIDDALHDLIMRRAAVVERIRGRKGDGVHLRPWREATILRRLAGRHRGNFPREVLVRIWREILGAAVRLQGPFSLAVTAIDGSPEYWVLARDQFGAHTPIVRHNSARHVIGAVLEGAATVGVLPVPTEGEPDPWWPLLAKDDPSTPRIVARLPFAAPAQAWGERVEALAVARLAPAATGEDRSLFTLESKEPISRTRLKDAFAESILDARFFCSWQDQTAWLHLAEIDGFLAPGDQRLSRLLNSLGEEGGKTVCLGAYAVPLPPETADSAGIKR